MVMTITEFARLGGLARAKALSPERRKEIARAAGLTPKRSRISKQVSIKANKQA